MAQGVGGALEIVAGGATLFTTGLTGVGAVGGGLLIASGVDNFMTGVQTAWDGKARHTMISDGIGSAAEWAGASPEMAEAIRSTSDIMTPGLATTLGRAGIRGGQQALGALALKPHDPFAPALAGGPQGATAASVFRQESAADSAGGVLAAAANAGEEAAQAAEGAAEKPKQYENASKRDFPGIPVTDNGGPTFKDRPDLLYPAKPGQKVVVTIKMSGSRRQYFYRAMEESGIAKYFPPKTERPPGYTWHHVDDFTPKTVETGEIGTCTMQLVFGKAHAAASNHKGSVYQWSKYFGKDYRR